MSIPKKLLVVGVIASTAYIAAVVVYNVNKPAPVQPTPPTIAPAQKPDVTELWNLTNQERNKAGLPSLVLDPKLNQSATDKCNDMITRDYWAHNTPSGIKPWTFIDKYAKYRAAGENLEYGSLSSTDVVISWMQSPEHRENILNRQYTNVGYAVCHSGNYIHQGGAYIVVQHFIQAP